jgi:pimeloyl-ACP methyl ester carboxylesterase
MTETKIKDITIYNYEGNGKKVMFVHAFPMTADMWHNQVNYFKKDYHVVTFDIRGFGKSVDSFNYIYTMEDFANDVLNIIEHLKLKDVNICGLSMGGYIVQRAVIKSPEKFSSMILADTKAEKEDDKGLLSRCKFIDKLKREGIGNFADEFMKRLMYKSNYENQELYNYIKSAIDKQNVKSLIGASIAMSTRTNTIDYFENISVPVLLMVGDNDKFTPLANSEKMKKHLKNSELKIIRNSGHLSPLENPEEFNFNLEKFLKTI